MTILPILKYPDPRLRTISKTVETFDEELTTLAQDMAMTMINAPGAGLAAPQVNRPLRLIVVDWTSEGETYGQNVLTLVNPEIVATVGHQDSDEGCLSVTDLQAKVHRAGMVEVEALDVTGRPFSVSAEGRRAVILQHEIDHLDGVLFLDHLSRLKQDLYKKKLKKILR
ncbi:MAG: peptide deformylase [Deltaproteobacteria bacterium]|jgi:peptide deformylase|nr:peptide deformylase [Deltaproteobacteria bacterium]